MVLFSLKLHLYILLAKNSSVFKIDILQFDESSLGDLQPSIENINTCISKIDNEM